MSIEAVPNTYVSRRTVMISSSLGSRLSGLALVLGGLIMAFAVFHVPTHPPLTALIPLVGGVLLCVGIPALYLRQAHQVGWVGLVGISILWLDLVIFPV